MADFDTRANRPHCIVSEEDVAWKTLQDSKNPVLNTPPSPTGFGGRFKSLSTAANGRSRAGLGCTLCEVPPGHALYPFHAHANTDEAMYILDGSGTLRLGKKRFTVESGDYINLKADIYTAHQLINTGDVTLRYLVIDRKAETQCDVVVYPDSKRTGCLVYTDHGPRIRFFEDDTSTGYFHDEPPVSVNTRIKRKNSPLPRSMKSPTGGGMKSPSGPMKSPSGVMMSPSILRRQKSPHLKNTTQRPAVPSQSKLSNLISKNSELFDQTSPKAKSELFSL